MGWTAGRHDFAQDPTRISKEKYSKKNILVRITQIWQNNSSKRTSKIISTKSKKF
jgi:hypothetical protein